MKQQLHALFHNKVFGIAVGAVYGVSLIAFIALSVTLTAQVTELTDIFTAGLQGYYYDEAQSQRLIDQINTNSSVKNFVYWIEIISGILLQIFMAFLISEYAEKKGGNKRVFFWLTIFLSFIVMGLVALLMGRGNAQVQVQQGFANPGAPTRFCGSCGSPVSGTGFCPNCGQPLSA